MLGPISHIALIVADPSLTAALFENLFDAKSSCRIDEDGHDETLLKLGDTRFVLVKADIKRERTGDHIAFQVTQELLQATKQKLAALGREYILARNETSLYFFDYDNHVFELVSMESDWDT
jgi:hypothetical protein